MEADICDLKRIAALLIHISERPGYLETDSLSPLAGLLHDIGVRLHDQFSDTFDILKVQA